MSGRRHSLGELLGEVVAFVADNPGTSSNGVERAKISDESEQLGSMIERELMSPMTATEIAKRVRRRRVVVQRVLDRDRRFVRVEAPPKRSRRAQTWARTDQAAGQVGTGRGSQA